MSAVVIETKLARNYTSENVADALAYLLVKIIPDPSQNFGTLPLNIGLVIDVSRSMKGRKIKYAMEAAKLLVNAMSENDWISVTVFSDEAKVIIPCNKISNKTLILAALDKIRTQSGTRMFLGMDLGAKEMQKGGLPGKVNRMILLTDGETENEDLCCTIARHQRGDNIVISNLGIGERYNEELLDKIANITLGSFLHLRSPEQINEIFQKEFNYTSAAVISDVTMSISLMEGVSLDSFNRIFPNFVKLKSEAENSNIFSESIGNISKNEPTIFGLRLKLPSQQTGRHKIAEVSVSYSVKSLDIRDKVDKRDVIVEYTGDQSLCSIVDTEVLGYFNQLNTQDLVDKAITESKSGNTAEATKSLTQARDITERLGNIPLMESITEAITELNKDGVITADGLKTIKAGSRQTIRIEKTDLK
jgi:Ca-activated chloride channel family protein